MSNICEKCKIEIKEIYYFGIKRIKLCKNCYEEEMDKIVDEELGGKDKRFVGWGTYKKSISSFLAKKFN